ATARRSITAARLRLAADRVELPLGAAPAEITVSLRAAHRVLTPAGGPRDANSVTLRTRATARLAFVFAPLPPPRPASAAGGGYDGPLAYRQGKAMRPDVALAFDRMFAAAQRDGHSLMISSAFRSDAEQARLFAQRPDPKWVAPPGTSLHRYGTELDLGPASAYAWLAANARRFGFIWRYKWEPWHYGFLANPRDVPAQYERGSFEPANGRFDGARGLPAYVPRRYAGTIGDAAQRWNVQPELLAAQLQAESGFDPNAVSPAGAQGIAQFMPGTARSVGLTDPFDPRQAIDAQAKLVGELIRRFGSITLALAAYNAGPGAIERYGGMPPYAETQAYVARILLLMKGGGLELSDPAFAGIGVTPRVELIE
ncbi:MAG: transglycosylase SLT domain-containing protein, partial [Thermoleophilia bacterium]|nr:transglycosylase SLT domain-containing protein [Thermoleophilia bacterium]